MWPFREFGLSIGKCWCSFSILRASRSFPVLWLGCYGGSVLSKSVRHGSTPHNEPNVCFSKAGDCCLRNQQSTWLLAINMNLIIILLSLILFSSKGTSGRMAYRTLCLSWVSKARRMGFQHRILMVCKLCINDWWSIELHTLAIILWLITGYADAGQLQADQTKIEF